MTNQIDSWQYDPFVQFSCTIGNQFEILMLIEMLELAGIHCVSANTDGAISLVPKELRETYLKICGEWEKIVGNTEIGRLEFATYERFVEESVNHYIGIKKDDKPKVKGRLLDIVPLNKNNTKDITRIQRKAIQDYFAKGIPVKQTIRECEDIFQFVFGYKSYGYHFVTTDKDGNQEQLKKLIRLYVSTGGVKLSKVKNEDNISNGVDSSQLLQGKLVTIYNRHIPEPIANKNIDYDFYIAGAQGVIEPIERASAGCKPRKSKKPIIINPAQTSMF